MFANGQTVIQLMEQLAPKHFAMEDDKIGLQLGTLQKEINKVLVALDVTDEVVDEAISAWRRSYHCPSCDYFRPLAKLDTATPAGKLYEKLIKNDIAVYIAHTNLDVAEGGINDWMADMLGIVRTVRLISRMCIRISCISWLCLYRRAIMSRCWRRYGAQEREDRQLQPCSFNIEGTGTFIPGEGTESLYRRTRKLGACRRNSRRDDCTVQRHRKGCPSDA